LDTLQRLWFTHYEKLCYKLRLIFVLSLQLTVVKSMSSFNTLAPQGAWSSGKLLIASRDAILPPCCIKCGRPAEPDFFPKKFRWHPQWLYIFVLIALLIYLILSLSISKRMKLQLPLCARHLEKYKSLRLAAAILLLGCIPEMIVAGNYLPESYLGYGIAAGLLALVAGLTCLIMFGALLRPTYIDQNYGYFANASPEFLSTLPRTPPGMILPR
jgi:hypothetical protein